MDKLQKELRAEGKEVNFLTVNEKTASADQSKLFDRCDFPVFQDTAEVNAWAKHGGGKDDLFVYDAHGKLAAYLPIGGSVSIVLSEDEGYSNLKKIITRTIALRP